MQRRSAPSPRASSRARCSRHAATGSSSSSRKHVATSSQSRSTSGSPRTCCAQPAFGAPTPHQLTVFSAMLLPADLRDLERHRAADALAVEVGEELGLGIAGRADQRVAGHSTRQLLQPLRRVRQRRVGPELDHRVPHVRVAVEDVDVRRAGAVRLRASARARGRRARGSCRGRPPGPPARSRRRGRRAPRSARGVRPALTPLINTCPGSAATRSSHARIAGYASRREAALVGAVRVRVQRDVRHASSRRPASQSRPSRPSSSAASALTPRFVRCSRCASQISGFVEYVLRKRATAIAGSCSYCSKNIHWSAFARS